MRQNDWTDKLPGLMEGYEEAEPKGLWDAVQAGLAPRKRRVAVWWYVAGIGLAAAAAVLLAVLLWKPSPAVSPVPEDRLVEEVPVGPEISVPEDVIPADDPPVPVSRRPYVSPAVEARKEVPEFASEETPEVAPVEASAETPAEAPAPETPREPKKAPSAPDPIPQEWIPAEVPASKARRSGRLQLSVRTGGLLAQAATSSYQGVGLTPYPVTKSSDLTPELVNRNRESNTDVQHRMRLRVSAQIAYAFAPRWSAGTGLTYSSLQSTYTTSAGNSISEEKTDYSYLGIPLFVQLKVVEYKRLSLYATAGGMFEIPLGAVMHSKIYSGSNVLSENVRNTDVRGVNNTVWSLNAGVGLQFELFKHGALFLQPELSWHIPGQSTLENFYTVRPLAFDVNFGLRIWLF